MVLYRQRETAAYERAESPSLDTPGVESATDAVDAVVEDEPLDDEAKMMAFVQCMRDKGIEFKDPVVDSEGNVQTPELVKGFTITREETV